MGFILGLLMGFLAALAMVIALAWLLLMRSNKEATASFLKGCAALLTYKKPPVTLNGQPEREPLGFQPKSRAKSEP
jgi:hypothetical protein